MKKFLKTVILMLLLISLSSCGKSDDGDADTQNPGGDFKMTARIEDIDEKITVDVIEAEYASGVHLVITSAETKFTDKNGKKIKKSDLKVGDTVEITFSGQVMLSYPPQIVASGIRLVK